MSCGVGRRHSLDPELLCLWLAAVALIRPLAWEFPYALGVALKRKKKKKRERERARERPEILFNDQTSHLQWELTTTGSRARG